MGRPLKCFFLTNQITSNVKFTFSGLADDAFDAWRDLFVNFPTLTLFYFFILESFNDLINVLFNKAPNWLKSMQSTKFAVMLNAFFSDHF